MGARALLADVEGMCALLGPQAHQCTDARDRPQGSGLTLGRLGTCRGQRPSHVSMGQRDHLPPPLRTSLSCRCLSLPISHTAHPVLAHMAIHHQDHTQNLSEQMGREIGCRQLSIPDPGHSGSVTWYKMAALVSLQWGYGEGIRSFSLEGSVG